MAAACSEVDRCAKGDGVDQTVELNRFLAGIEARALRIAEVALRNRDDALDVVQEAMVALARRYGHRPVTEWRPLFYRILHNGVRDCLRRRAVRSKLFSWLRGPRRGDDADTVAEDPIARVADAAAGPERRAIVAETMDELGRALEDLPARQREAFLLRCLEGMDVAETAVAMRCSEGSVKTHYFRALEALRERLAEAWL